MTPAIPLFITAMLIWSGIEEHAPWPHVALTVIGAWCAGALIFTALALAARSDGPTKRR